MFLSGFYEVVQWASDICNVLLAYMGINLRGLGACMTQQFLNISQVCPIFKQVCRTGMSIMSKGVHHGRFGK